MITQVYHNPNTTEWDTLLQRPTHSNPELNAQVQAILHDVQLHGDAAVLRNALKWDEYTHNQYTVTPLEISEALHTIEPALKQAIDVAYNNIKKFHQAQCITEPVIETMPGVHCWRRSVPIQKVGLYIPGGTAPLLSTVLMLGVPAQLAGCPHTILCTPVQGNAPVHPAILYAAQLCGISNVYKVGGAAAIAAMAYGTATIPKVHKILGPGNSYVTAAKQAVQLQGVAIDMPAGPSEVCILADDTAIPAYVAADLLAQAEHGTDSQVILITTSNELVHKVQEALTIQCQNIPRKHIATQALAHSKIIVFNNLNTAIQCTNAYAAEHLIICTQQAAEVAQLIHTAGSIFIGNYSPESVGDYASGTNHTLPTHGYAAAYSGVSVDSFVKKITYQQLSLTGLHNIAATVVTMAQAEQLHAHAYAVQVRLQS